jgi:hypothetical protein
LLPERPGLVLDLGRQCGECLRLVGPDEPLTRTPFETDACAECAGALALRILGGLNRDSRRRNAARTRLKGDRKRKRKRR